MIRTLRILLRVAIPALLVLASTFAMTAFYYLHGSYPDRQGRLIVTGLQARVEIDRNAMGVPDLTAHHTEDLSFALGFVHAQDRFFAMDLARRYTAGTLGDLLGDRIPDDPGRFSGSGDAEALRQRLLALSAENRQLISAYTRGVNTALEEMAHAPPEYLYLRQRPQDWTEADSLRVLDHYEQHRYAAELTDRGSDTVTLTQPERTGVVSPVYPVQMMLTDQAVRVTGFSTPGAPVLRHGWTAESQWLHLPPDLTSASLPTGAGQRFITVAGTETLGDLPAGDGLSPPDGPPHDRHPLMADGWLAGLVFTGGTPEGPSGYEVSLGPDGNRLILHDPVSRHPLRPWDTTLPVTLPNGHTEADPDQLAFQLDLLPQRLPLFTEELPGS